MSNEITRRDLFARGSVLAVGLMTPSWLSAVTHSDMVRQASGKRVDPNNVLVVIQLSGGNDGLNTVVPFTDPLYHKARPSLALPESSVLKIGDGLGFHPALAGLHELFQKGQVAVVQNVGYPNPNRSHFKSMDIWQSASPDLSLRHGWVGRAFDVFASRGPVNPIAGLGLSTERPLALTAQKATIPCFASLTDIQGMIGDPDAEKMLREIQGMAAMEGSTTRTIQDANNTALDAMAVLQKQLAGFQLKQTYGTDAFGRGFSQISQIVATSPATRVVYFSAGGFDTHANQKDAHERLLKGFGDGLNAFMKEMEAAGRADKVMVVVFSEFGRRTYENGSAGTDHGAAAPMFVVGKQVKGGIYGPKPDLQDLLDGDVRFKVDFRQVYATALDEWLGNDSKVVLGQQFGSLPILK